MSVKKLLGFLKKIRLSNSFFLSACGVEINFFGRVQTGDRQVTVPSEVHCETTDHPLASHPTCDGVEVQIIHKRNRTKQE